MTRRLGLLVAAAALLLASQSAGAARTTVSGLSEPEAIVGGSATASGSAYTFTSLLSGKPVRWNPCRPIHWVFRPYGAPSGALPVVQSAVARIARATGTTWVYDGQVLSAPSSRWLPSSSAQVRPLLIGWTDAAHSDLLRGRPSTVLGVTRTAWFGTVQNGVTTAAIQAAVVALDRTDRLPLTGTASWRTVLLHELGHAMGLGHAGSSAQVMYPTLQRRFTDLQPGDLTGLSRVGRAAGCINL
ncbi:MAG: matrixin family metalloprotease [Mycobacteriales bacterium]